MTQENGMSRRAMLVKLGVFLNGIVGAALAVPIMRFLLSPVTREKKFGYESWLSLGGLEQFPAGQTRLATYRNPVVNSWDGETGMAKPATLHAGCATLTIRRFKFLRSTVRILDARFAGFPSRTCLCVPATAALTTRTDPVLQDLPSADYSSTATKLRTENFSSKLAKCRPLVSP